MIVSIDEKVIQNSHPNRLYKHSIRENLDCFNVVSEEQIENEYHIQIKVSPKVQLKVTYSLSSEDIKSFTITKVSKGKATEKLSLHNSSIVQLKGFLEFITTFNLSDISHKRIRLIHDEDAEIDEETRKQVVEILKREDSTSLIKELLNARNITSEDIVNTGYRKSQLDIFKGLLIKEDLSSYDESENFISPNIKSEKEWQRFFMSNQWIFGYGLDYRFQGVLQDEYHVSNTDASGKGSVIADFLMGDKKFTSFVEIKLPTTPLFARDQNRSGCWKLSRELIDAYSQILEQKASGQIKIENQTLHDSNEMVISQKSYDSKTVLVIGNLDSELSDNTDLRKGIKSKTFELFRRDSRNVEIITYDELYERAKFIVDHG